jgi:hypothetical protein
MAVRNRGRVTRFVVMAMLQAARARRLGLPRDSAYSWGLNRSIFYAAAKQGFRGAAPAAAEGGKAPAEGKPKAEPEPGKYSVGDDFGFTDPKSEKLYFTIGGETQTEKDFERQVIARFGGPANFERAWREAEAIVGEFDEDTVRAGRKFYDRVYRPRRDELSDKWSALAKSSTSS